MTTTLFDAIFKVDYSQVDKASEAVKNLGTANKGTSDAASHMGTIFGSMGGVVGEASSHLNHFTQTAKEVYTALEKLAAINVTNIAGMSKFGSTLTYTAGIMTGFIAILGVVSLKMLESWEQKIQEAADLGRAFNLTASQALLMGEAAKDAGSSLEGIEGMYAKVARAAQKSGDETKGMGAAFKVMGVEVENSHGKIRGAKDITDELIKKWDEGKKGADEYAAMLTLLGKKFQVSAEGHKAATEAEKIAAEQQLLNIGITNEASKAIDEHKSGNLRLLGVMSDVGSYLVEMLVPAITSLVQWFNKSYEAGGFVYGVFNLLVTAAGAVGVAIKLLSATLIGLDFLFTSLVRGAGAVGAAFNLFIHGDWSGAKNVWDNYTTDVAKHADDSANAVKKLNEELGHTVPKALPGIDTPGENGVTKKSKNIRTIPMESTPPLPTDPYLAFSNSLIKAQESLDHVSESMKVQTQLDIIDAAQLLKNNEIAQKNLEIDKYNIDNAAKIAAGDLNKKIHLEKLDEELIKNEKIRIRQQGLDIDSKIALELQIKQYDELDKMVTEYNNTITKQIANKHKSAEVIADEAMKQKIQEQLEIQLIEVYKTKYDINGQLIDQEKRASDLRAKAADEIDKVTAATKRLTDSQKDWANNGIDAFITGLGTLNQGLEKIVTGSLQSFSDTLYTLVTTGKNGFKGMVASMLESLAKLVFQMYVVIPLMNQMKASMSGGSGIMGMLGNLFGMGGGGAGAGIGTSGEYAAMGWLAAADGAEVVGNNNGHSILVGEKGPELFVPKGAGSIIPNNQLGTATNATTITNSFQINVTGATDPEKTGQQVAMQVKQLQLLADNRIANQLRPGGMLNRHSTPAF